MRVTSYRLLAASSLALVLAAQPCRANVGSENRGFHDRTPATDRFMEPQSTVEKLYKSMLTMDMVRGKGIEDDIQNKDKESLMGIINYVFDNETKGKEQRHVARKLECLVKGGHMFTAEQRRQIVLGLAVTTASEMRAIAKTSGGPAYVEEVFSTFKKTTPENEGRLKEVRTWVLSEEKPEGLADRLIGTATKK